MADASETRNSTVTAIVVAAVLSALIQGEIVHSLGADIAHHFALVATLFEDGTRPDTAPNLIEMAYYPPLSHWIAVILGRMTGLPFTSMIWVSVAAMAAQYAIILALIALSGSVVAIVVAAAMVFAAWYFHFAAIYGYEINGNFFYSQIVASALAWGAVLALFYLPSSWRRDGFALAAIVVVGFAHLLPALWLSAVYGLILVSETLVDRSLWKRLVAFAVIGMAVIFFHPSTSAMANISENNGVLPFLFTTKYVFRSIVAACLVLSAVLYFVAPKGSSLRWLALGGVAAGVLASLQVVAFVLGKGSAYAVLKHMFNIYTLSIITAASIVGLLIQRVVGDPRVPPAFLIVPFAVFMTWTIQRPNLVHSRPIDELAAFATEYRRLGHVNDTVVLSRSAHTTVRYMLSIASLRHPRNVVSYAVLAGAKLPEPVSYAIVDKADPAYAVACATADAPPSSRYFVVDLKCVGK